MPNHVYVPYGHMMASSEERGENGIRGEEGTFESFFFFITKSEAGSVKRKYLKTWMWVSGCFRLKPQKDKTRRTLRAAAGGRSRRGSRGAGRGRARRSGPLRRLRALPAPRLRDGPARAGAPEKPPGAGRPRPGNAGGGPAAHWRGPAAPPGGPAGSVSALADPNRFRSPRAMSPRTGSALSPRAQGRPAASKKTTTTHDGFQLFLFSF